MKKYAMPMAIATVGLGLLSIGFSLNGNTASATPAGFNPGPAEPTIVWYDAHMDPGWPDPDYDKITMVRAWSDGTVEAKYLHMDNSTVFSGACQGLYPPSDCNVGWVVISHPQEGLNASADINLDSLVDAADLGLLVSAWGEASRSSEALDTCRFGTTGSSKQPFHEGDAQIVWYKSQVRGFSQSNLVVWRAWSNGLIQVRLWSIDNSSASSGCDPIRSGSDCYERWADVSPANEGLNARADINFDERVDAADLGQLIAAWGDAPRNDYPPSSCPLGLIP